MSETQNPVPGPQTIQPGPEHEVFKKDVGIWDATVELRLSPGASPQISSGIAKNRLTCGGLWLITEFLNETTGFEGHGIYGYDPVKGKYVGTWVDAMRTFIAVSEGIWDPGTQTMTMWIEASGPHGRPIRWREVTETKSPDLLVWHQIMSGPGRQEFELATVTYTRRE